jgi:hypothetical protein
MTRPDVNQQLALLHQARAEQHLAAGRRTAARFFFELSAAHQSTADRQADPGPQPTAERGQ